MIGPCSSHRARALAHGGVEVSQPDHLERGRQLVGEGALGKPCGLTGKVKVAVQRAPRDARRRG